MCLVFSIIKNHVYLLCSLCSIVNKILAHVIEIILVFILFKFKKLPNISRIWVVIAVI